MQPPSNLSPRAHSLISGIYREFLQMCREFGFEMHENSSPDQSVKAEIPYVAKQGIFLQRAGHLAVRAGNRQSNRPLFGKRPSLADLFCSSRTLFSPSICRWRERDGERAASVEATGEAFWRAHHAWKRSDLNQRQYCEAEGIRRRRCGHSRTPSHSRRCAS